MDQHFFYLLISILGVMVLIIVAFIADKAATVAGGTIPKGPGPKGDAATVAGGTIPKGPGPKGLFLIKLLRWLFLIDYFENRKIQELQSRI